MKPVPLVMLSSKPACDSSENHAPAEPGDEPADDHGLVADLDRRRCRASRRRAGSRRRTGRAGPNGVLEQHEPVTRDDDEHREEDRLVREQLLADDRDVGQHRERDRPVWHAGRDARAATITSERRKPVSPSASRLITTPEMIWSTRNVTDSERVQQRR